MKLYLNATSEREARPARKGGDDHIAITLSNKGINVFDVTFTDDGHNRGKLEIMSYNNGQSRVIEYIEKA